MSTRTISIASDFSRTPAGRYRADGPAPGERFRDEWLLPALREQDGPVEVVFDGVAGFGSSFLEEAFGGLVRQGFTPAVLHQRLHLSSSERPSVAARVWTYIDEACASH